MLLAMRSRKSPLYSSICEITRVVKSIAGAEVSALQVSMRLRATALFLAACAGSWSTVLKGGV